MGGPTQKGIIQYSVSPFQQNAMKGALHSYLFYGFKRIMQQAPYFAVPFAAGKFRIPSHSQYSQSSLQRSSSVMEERRRLYTLRYTDVVSHHHLSRIK